VNRRTALVVLALVTTPALLACSRSGNGPAAAPAELRSLTVDEVAARLAAGDGKTFVYDNNSKDRYDQGHVPGARWVESGEVTAAVLPPDKSATLVFYCMNEH
jgi:hypothetical protein